jgi:polyhydroxyalkanoate synthase
MNEPTEDLKSIRNKSIEESCSLPPKCKTYNYEGLNFDRMFHAWIGHYASWLSPSSFMQAYFDWLACLNISPARQ